jgi:hypothetical protein
MYSQKAKSSLAHRKMQTFENASKKHGTNLMQNNEKFLSEFGGLEILWSIFLVPVSMPSLPSYFPEERMASHWRLWTSS